MISSARPSLKYSFSLSPLMFSNGRTAIDGLGRQIVQTFFERDLHLVHRRKSLADLLGQASPHDALESRRHRERRRVVTQDRAHDLRGRSPPKGRVPESIS